MKFTVSCQLGKGLSKLENGEPFHAAAQDIMKLLPLLDPPRRLTTEGSGSNLRVIIHGIAIVYMCDCQRVHLDECREDPNECRSVVYTFVLEDHRLPSETIPPEWRCAFREKLARALPGLLIKNANYIFVHKPFYGMTDDLRQSDSSSDSELGEESGGYDKFSSSSSSDDFVPVQTMEEKYNTRVSFKYASNTTGEGAQEPWPKRMPS